MIRAFLVGCLCAVMATSTHAESSRQSAIAEIVTAGTHEHEDRFHTVEIDDCILTTYVYEDWGEHPKVLWSSFRVHIRALSFMDPNTEGDRFIWAPNMDADGNALALIPISVREPASARHEMAMRRNPKKPYTPSPREGLDDYVYIEKSDFFIIQLGLTSKDKPAQFISALERYRLEYCVQLG